MRANLRRLLICVIAAAAVVAIVVGFSGSQRPGETKIPGVARVYPPGGDLDLRQVKIGAFLSPGYTGALQIDGVEVSERDLRREPALSQIELAPKEGSEFAELAPARHCATVIVWPVGGSRVQGRAQQWCFDLH